MHAAGGFGGGEIPVVAIETATINHPLDRTIGALDIGHIGEAALQTEFRLQEPHDFKLTACQFMYLLSRSTSPVFRSYDDSSVTKQMIGPLFRLPADIIARLGRELHCPLTFWGYGIGRSGKPSTSTPSLKQICSHSRHSIPTAETKFWSQEVSSAWRR